MSRNKREGYYIGRCGGDILRGGSKPTAQRILPKYSLLSIGKGADDGTRKHRKHWKMHFKGR